MSDTIEDIRARHLIDSQWRGGWAESGTQLHEDRAALLAEVDRQREEIFVVRRYAEQLTRERDEARAEVERLRGTIRQVALAADGCISRDKIVCICHEALEAKP